MKKVAVNQLFFLTIYGGILAIPFAIAFAFLEEEDWPKFKTECDNDDQVLAEWIGFILSQMINFYFVPTRFRVLYEYTASLGYDIYTGQVIHKHTVGDYILFV